MEETTLLSWGIIVVLVVFVFVYVYFFDDS